MSGHLYLVGYQDYFKELTDQDVRKRLYEEQKNQIEQDMAPFGFISDGLDEGKHLWIRMETDEVHQSVHMMNMEHLWWLGVVELSMNLDDQISLDHLLDERKCVFVVRLKT